MSLARRAPGYGEALLAISGSSESTKLMEEVGAMTHALELAAGVRWRTAPNPWVGAVLLNASGHVVGLGATEPAGGAHAEMIAIARARAAVVGPTLVVTLKPCSHHGRTPPCVDAIVAAGIARVIIGVNDPDQRVTGRDIAALQTAGVNVEVGLLGHLVSTQLEPYLHHRRTGRPYVVSTLARTLDSGIAAPDRSSRWITGQEARTDVHRLRAESDAVVRSFHDHELIDQYVSDVEPALLADSDMLPLLTDPTPPSIDALGRGRLVAVRRLGEDLRFDLIPHMRSATMPTDHRYSIATGV